jgi:hypothetical protein
MRKIDRIGGGGAPRGETEIEEQLAALDLLDAMDGAGAAEKSVALLAQADDGVDAAARAARATTLDEALLKPAAEHAARAIELGAVTAALHRVVKRPARANESPAESRMRQIVEKYLELRLEVAAGIARISVG